MTETQHTPGPWWVERRVGDALQVNAHHRGPASSYCVASLNHWEGETDRANATLIAAAPDLLALAKQLANECSECNGTGAIPVTVNAGDLECEPCPDCFDIRTVIAKAEGKSYG